MAHGPRIGGIEFWVLYSDLSKCIIMRESQGRCDMDKDVEEYRAIRQHIHGQFTLIFQVFTVSIVAAIALLGYALNNILGAFAKAQDVSSLGVYLFFPLIPLAVIVPFAFLIKSLRKEIFKWRAYVEVYLEDGKDWKYETELDKYMTKYRERESFNPIAISYFVLSGLCFAFSVGLYLYKFQLSFPNLFYLMAILVFAVIIGWLHKKWWDDYKDIPIEARKGYILRWKETKNDNSESAQVQNSREPLFNRDDRDEIVGLLHEINNRLAYQKDELALQWISSFGLAIFALGIAFIGVSITLPIAQAVEKTWFHVGAGAAVVGPVIFIVASIRSIYIKKKKPPRSNC